MRSRIQFFTLFSITAALFAEEAIDPERAANTIILSEAAVQNIGIETEVAEEQTFETSLFAIGRIEEIPSKKAVLSTRIPGRIVAIDVFEGDTVTEGQVLARIESLQPGDPPPTIKLVAPRAGLITQSHVRLGQPVEPGNELLDISDRSSLWAVAQIPEQEASPIAIGTLAKIRIPALGKKVFQAKLTRFGVTADRDSNSIEGIFEISNNEGLLRPGLRAEFSFITAVQEDVMAIPRSAIQGSLADRVVFVKDFELENAYLRSPVVLGQQNEEFVEVISGLFPGDEVVTKGSYALNFAGGGNGPSLKEALDAAHGHEHNEDGSEITADQKKEEAEHDDHAHDHGNSRTSRIIKIWAISATVLALIFAQLFWNQTRKNRA